MRPINHCMLRPIVRAIVVSCDRAYDESLHPTTDRMINREVQRSITRSIVVTYDRSWYDQSWHPTTDHTTDRGTRRPIARSIVASDERSDDQWCDCRSAIIHNWRCHQARLLVRSGNTYLRPLTIWNRRLEVLNITSELAATDFTLAITHDICDQSCVPSKICPSFQYFSVVARS